MVDPRKRALEALRLYYPAIPLEDDSTPGSPSSGAATPPEDNPCPVRPLYYLIATLLSESRLTNSINTSPSLPLRLLLLSGAVDWQRQLLLASPQPDGASSTAPSRLLKRWLPRLAAALEPSPGPDPESGARIHLPAVALLRPWTQTWTSFAGSRNRPSQLPTQTWRGTRRGSLERAQPRSRPGTTPSPPPTPPTSVPATLNSGILSPIHPHPQPPRPLPSRTSPPPSATPPTARTTTPPAPGKPSASASNAAVPSSTPSHSPPAERIDGFSGIFTGRAPRSRTPATRAMTT